MAVTNKMKFKKIIIPILFVIALTAFIFSNSIKGPSQTNSDSGFILSLIKPIVDKFIVVDSQSLHIIIRKLAHFTEFCWLGLATNSLCVILQKQIGKNLLGISAFYCLLIGVLDEFIQSFTNRTSSVKDVIIDFSGALLGIIIVSLINEVLKNKKHH